MSENAVLLLASGFLVWIGSMIISAYLLMTHSDARRSTTTLALFGCNGLAVVMLLFAIARAAGAL